MFTPSAWFGGLQVLLLGVALSGFLGMPGQLHAQLRGDGARIDAHLAAGEFGPAISVVQSMSDSIERDHWLAAIAKAQVRSGARRGAVQTAYAIQGETARGAAFEQLEQHPLGRGARGGAALADFDTLIDLITSTVEPDSWDTIGGPGAISSFPTGVFVDASGLMKVRATDSEMHSLRALRGAAYRDGGNRDLYADSEFRKVSLTRLERHVQMRWAMGKRPDDAMQTFAGMFDVNYVLVFPEARDIVLVGRAGGWERNSDGRIVNARTGRPVLSLDDFVAVARNAFSERPVFGCAITPEKAGLASVQSFLRESSSQPLKKSQRTPWLNELRGVLGEQKIDVFGVDPRTHAARVLVEADYHMKLVGMGLAEGTPGVSSYLATVTLDDDGKPPAMDVLRWWFTLGDRVVRTTESGDAFQLTEQTVKVQSESELLDDRGGRIHTGRSSDLNRRFAQSFTRNFDALAEKYPIYAELRNLFDLAIVAGILRSEGVADRIDWRLSHFKNPERYRMALGTAPGRVASVINHREMARRHLVVGVSGGVRVDTGNLVGNARPPARDQSLEAVIVAGDPAEVAPGIWWWD